MIESIDDLLAQWEEDRQRWEKVSTEPCFSDYTKRMAHGRATQLLICMIELKQLNDRT